MAFDGLTGQMLLPAWTADRKACVCSEPRPLQRVTGHQRRLLPWLQAQVSSSGSHSGPSSREHFSSGPALDGAFDKILLIFRTDVYMLGRTQSL